MLCPTSRLPFLTKIHLTPRALRELNRRNNLPGILQLVPNSLVYHLAIFLNLQGTAGRIFAISGR